MRRLVARLPVWVRTAPMDAMFALLGIPSGFVSLLGPVRSRALDELLPWWATRLWAVCLLVGCIAWLTGLTSVREQEGLLVATRLPVLILGLRLLSMVTLVYGVAILIIGGWAGVLAAWPLLVASVATYLRWMDLSDRLRDQP